MYTTDIAKIRQQLSRVLAVIDPIYIDTILSLHKRLDKEHIFWAIGGNLGETLRAVQVEPDCIEILTDRKGAAQIFMAFKEFSRKGVLFQTQRLERKAVAEDMEYPVYARSYYFDFSLNGVKVKVYGDLQFKVGNWEWGDKLEFTPEHVSVVGAKTAIVPLRLKYQLYQDLGWADRAEKISQVIDKHPSTFR